MTLRTEDVAHVAKLACLALSDDELQRYGQELSGILALVEQLDTLDLASVSEADADSVVTAPITGLGLQSFRVDHAENRYTRAGLFQNAPAEEDGFFRVPRILEVESGG